MIARRPASGTLQEDTMLTPVISLLPVGVWLTYLTIIAARAAPALRALAHPAGRDRQAPAPSRPASRPAPGHIPGLPRYGELGSPYPPPYRRRSPGGAPVKKQRKKKTT